MWKGGKNMGKAKKKEDSKNNKFGKTLAIVIGSAYLVNKLKGKKNKK